MKGEKLNGALGNTVRVRSIYLDAYILYNYTYIIFLYPGTCHWHQHGFHPGKGENVKGERLNADSVKGERLNGAKVKGEGCKVKADE